MAERPARSRLRSTRGAAACLTKLSAKPRSTSRIEPGVLASLPITSASPQLPRNIDCVPRSNANAKSQSDYQGKGPGPLLNQGLRVLGAMGSEFPRQDALGANLVRSGGFQRPRRDSAPPVQRSSQASDTHIVTLVERHSRFTMLVKLPRKDTTTVVAALAKHIRKLPEQLQRSLTWDQGKEMSGHKRFTVATNVQVYFCDPRSPGSVAATRTPTACCDSTSREEPISRASPKPTSMALL